MTMKQLTTKHSLARSGALWITAFLGLASLPTFAAAQAGGGNQGGGNQGGGNQGGGGTTVITGSVNAVGGVAIDASGVLNNADLDATGELRRVRTKMLQAVDVDLDKPSEMRKISLRRLEAALSERLKTDAPLPDEMVLLAGLQRIRYVLVYPEQQDIVLVGYAEGWKVGDHGDIVGQSNGRPVMQLDDLLVTLRAFSTQPGVISCSIDPTPEGLARLKQFTGRLRTIGNPERTIAGIEETLGPQTISVTGVPATSRLARVLVAADYRMKRFAMGFDEAPVAGLPSFLDLLASSKSQRDPNMMPRWWLAPAYEPLLRDGEGLAYELRGANVKCLTEEDYASTSGQREHTGKGEPIAQQWADAFTDKYSELALQEAVFGELQNIMDLAIVAALVVKENLPAKAGCELPLLMQEGPLSTSEWDAPRHVDSKATFRKRHGKWIISASGGVQIDPWSIASQAETSEQVGYVRKDVTPSADRWWWD